MIATLFEVHEGFAWVTIISNGLAGAWALGAHWWEPLRTRALWWFTAVAQSTVFIQVGLGVAMVSGQKRHAPEFHMFYGFLGIIAVGIIYSYRQQMERYRYLLYGLGGLFVMGLSIRAMLVGER